MKSKLFMALVAVFLTLPLFAAFGQEPCGTDPGARDTVRVGPVVVPVVTPGDTFAVPIYMYSDSPVLGMSLGIKWSGTNIRYYKMAFNPDFVTLGFQRQIYRTDTTLSIIGPGVVSFDPSSPFPANTGNVAVKIWDIWFQVKAGATADVISLDSAKFGPAGRFLISDETGANDICPEFVNSPTNADVRLPVQEFDGPVLPEAFSISQNNPNPFNPTTSIDFALPTAAKTKIEVFNILGQKVKTLVDEYLTAGNKRVDWDGTDDRGSAVASGIYLYRMTANDFTETKKMMLMK
ncbi:MAG: T9SS type A sorting domain-containing protein [bacterium]|nr:T9SS type A sorting domain-containing protein [bacterium]